MKPNFEAEPTVMLKVLLVAPVKLPEAAVSVYPVPTLSIEIFEKEATPVPLTAFWLKVPLSVPVPALVPIARVTGFSALVTVFPWVS